nr:uncharacterized protein LOC114822268 [Malus domestica]
MAITCWEIWKARCKGVFQSLIPSPARTIITIEFNQSIFLEADQVNRAQRDSSGANIYGWQPPPPGIIKVNVDASRKKVDGFCHIGEVILDFDSQCLAVRRRRIRAITVQLGEVLGVLEGCCMARQMGFSHIVIESDSKGIIESLNGCIEQGAWELFPVLGKIRSEYGSFVSYDWSWVLRSANKAADYVASYTGAKMCDFV